MAKSKKETQKQPARQPAKRSTRSTRKSSSKAPTRASSEAKKSESTRLRRKTAPKAPPKETPRKQAPPPTPKQEPKKEPQAAPQPESTAIKLAQNVAILVDGNNIEMSLHSVSGKKGAMINFDKLVPALLQNRALSRFIYFREGKSISAKLAERLQKMFHGSVVPCYKSADIPLTIKAVQVASKVDTIIILSGDADYMELVRHLKHDGIRVEIAAFPETTAEILRNEADYVFPITVDYSFVLK